MHKLHVHVTMNHGDSILIMHGHVANNWPQNHCIFRFHAESAHGTQYEEISVF